MEDRRAEQLDLLKTLAEFNDGLVHNMGIIIKEYRGARLDDTNKFMDGIVDAMNWEIEAFNATKDLINEEGEVINRDQFEDAICALNMSIKDKDDGAMASCLEEVMVFFEAFGNRAKELTA